MTEHNRKLLVIDWTTDLKCIVFSITEQLSVYWRISKKKKNYIYKVNTTSNMKRLGIYF